MQRQIVMFAGNDASDETSLWETNGTAAGTHEITGISGASPVVFDPSGMTVFNGEMLFDGVDASGKYGLWVTDGTGVGTHEITGIAGANLVNGIGAADLTVLNNEVLFVGQNLSGYFTLWATNGTTASTHEITGISGANVELQPGYLTVFRANVFSNAEVLFSGIDAGGRFGLWLTDGTATGTHEITGISGVSSGGVDPSDLTVLKLGSGITASFEALFDGEDAGSNQGLWVTDGSPAGTHEITGISGAYASGGLFHFANYRPDMTVFGHEVLFNGNNASGQAGLWVTNGTTPGTHEITGISGAFFKGIAPQYLTVFNSEVLFNGTNAGGQVGLWVTDGTTTGTHELTGIIGRDSDGIDPAGLTVFNSEVLFNGTDVNGHTALWETDGTAVGTRELSVAGVFTSGFDPFNFTPATLTIPPADNFTSDNTSDILFRNTSTGDTWYEAMNNGAFAGWNQIGGSDTSFSVVGVGDFNSDGADDILFRNNATGDTWFEALNNGTFAGWQQIGGSDTRYSVVGVGDFFGTGTDDILFRNNTTGDTWFEAISNGASAGWNPIGGSDTNYAVVGVGDYFGNNTSGILFRNSAGDTWFEAISNGAFAWYQIGGSDSRYGVPSVLGPPSLK
jgi:hypothetical protein